MASKPFLISADALESAGSIPSGANVMSELAAICAMYHNAFRNSSNSQRGRKGAYARSQGPIRLVGERESSFMKPRHTSSNTSVSQY